MTDKIIKSEAEEVVDQVDVQSVCKNFDMGRYQIIELVAYVARQLDLRPHDAMKRLLQEDDLEAFKIQLEENEKLAKLSRELRKS